MGSNFSRPKKCPVCLTGMLELRLPAGHGDPGQGPEPYGWLCPQCLYPMDRVLEVHRPLGGTDDPPPPSLVGWICPRCHTRFRYHPPDTAPRP
ncbi:MAG: hypothetical protein PHZ19_05040 [Candidatus Thermoplasmatota archaeon]|nr:hypothetical protein [Candidatus Thermoplasmatota archaeon]